MSPRHWIEGNLLKLLNKHLHRRPPRTGQVSLEKKNPTVGLFCAPQAPETSEGSNSSPGRGRPEGSRRNMLEPCKPGLGVVQLIILLELGTAVPER